MASGSQLYAGVPAKQAFAAYPFTWGGYEQSCVSDHPWVQPKCGKTLEPVPEAQEQAMLKHIAKVWEIQLHMAIMTTLMLEGRDWHDCDATTMT